MDTEKMSLDTLAQHFYDRSLGKKDIASRIHYQSAADLSLRIVSEIPITKREVNSYGWHIATRTVNIATEAAENKPEEEIMKIASRAAKQIQAAAS